MRASLTLPENERIVVTGMGAVTPVGRTLPESWEAIKEGIHGIRHIDDTRLASVEGIKEIGANVAAPAPDIDILQDPYLKANSKDLRPQRWHTSARLGFWAMYNALKDADLLHPEVLRLDPEKVDRFRAGFYIGSTFSGIDELGSIVGKPGSRIGPSNLLRYLPARAATGPAMPLGLNGPGGMIAEECASGGSAIRLGAKEMNPYWYGFTDADVMVVGGTDAELSQYNMLLFEAAGDAVDTTDQPELASRPLDKNRDGLVMGEGSGAFVLETLSHAKARGLKDTNFYAELVGHSNLTEANGETEAGADGARRVIQMAMSMAGVQLKEVVYINGHFTSTKTGDPIEAKAMGEAIDNLGLHRGNVWLTSTKGATGHTMGAAGAIEAAFAIAAMNDSVIPPALKLRDPIPEVEGFNLSPLERTELPNIDVAVSTSYGFGGTAAALAFRKFEP